MEKIKYSYARLLTKICVNSTKTFQTQTGWTSFLDEDPNMAYNNFIDEYSRAGGRGGRDEFWDRETMFSQLAKRSPSVVFSGKLQYFTHSKYFYTF